MDRTKFFSALRYPYLGRSHVLLTHENNCWKADTKRGPDSMLVDNLDRELQPGIAVRGMRRLVRGETRCGN